MKTPRNLNYGNYIPDGQNQFGHDGGMTAGGERIPAAAMAEIVALRKELAETLIDKPLPLHVAEPRGITFVEMRENLFKNELYNMGDAVLIWVNEGDLGRLTIYEKVVHCTDIDTTK